MSTHWGWYWKVKMKHTAKTVCSWPNSLDIDSFQMFKNDKGEFDHWKQESKDHIVLVMPPWKLTMTMQDDKSLKVVFDSGSYIIPVEKRSCNFGGYYHFFHCPECSIRMRKLYFQRGKYLCRKCANLAYYTQQLRPSERNGYGKNKVEEYLKNKSGSLQDKPRYMSHSSFQKLHIKYIKYEELEINADGKELLDWYGAKAAPYVEPYFGPLDSNLWNAYVERM